MIKVCINPACGAVWHNCPKTETHCLDCGTIIIKINEKTYWKKFANSFFQYDFITGNIFRPQPTIKQGSLFKGIQQLKLEL